MEQEILSEEMLEVARRIISNDLPEKTREVMVDEILDIVLMSRCPGTIISRGPILGEDTGENKCPQNTDSIDNRICAACMKTWLLKEPETTKTTKEK